MQLKVSIVIASYNMAHLILETIGSCMAQDYPNKEIIVYDDCSTDNTAHIDWNVLGVKYRCGVKNGGVGYAFNEGIKYATGEIVIIMCADDLFLDNRYISDVVKCFQTDYVGYVTRWYSQFIDGDMRPVRAWRGLNPVLLANNPSGLAFRTKALIGCKCSNKMFIETSQLAFDVLLNGWGYRILRYDAIGARVHGSTSTTPAYWLKRRVSSPVMDWWNLGVKEITTDYVSFIQIKNGFKMSAVYEEIWNFIKLRPKNLITPAFWFWAIVAIVIPRGILRKLPGFYRKYIGVRTTREVKRP